MLAFTSTELDIPAVPGLRIVVNTPQDAGAWARLPLTRRNRARPGTQ